MVDELNKRWEQIQQQTRDRYIVYTVDDTRVINHLEIFQQQESLCMYVWLNEYVYICTCMYMYTCMYVWYVCMCTYICDYL